MLDSPYKGLMPYIEEDAAFFFGRDTEREVIIANLMASRLTLLYGASGVGKSSVLHAGVTHRLQQVAEQNREELGTPEFAVVVFNAWRDDPLLGLTIATQDAVSSTLNLTTQIPIPPRQTLDSILKEWSERLGGDLLIILDQFEEYFLYHSREDGEGTFAVEFPRIVNNPELRVNFLIAIREDALAQLDRFKGRIPNLFENYLRLDHLSRTAAEEAVRKPLAAYNEQQGTDGSPVTIEDALVETVLDQVRTGQVQVGETGRGEVKNVEVAPALTRIETPYLQLVMTRLWQEEQSAGSQVLRQETLAHLGGATEIVQTHLDGVMSALSTDEQALAAHVFQYLVTRSRTKVAYPVLDLAGEAGIEEASLSSVLEKLSRGDARILRQVGPVPGMPIELRYERYEIFHDVLASAILDWRTRHVQQQEIIELERRAEEQRLRDETERQAEERRRIDREKREQAEREVEMQTRAAKRLRRFSIGLVALLVLAFWAAYLASQQRMKAEAAQKTAQEEGQRAEQQAQFAQEQQAQAEAAGKTAQEERQRAEEEAKKATQLAHTATARKLAAQAREVLDGSRDLALLLSVEATRLDESEIEGTKSLIDILKINSIPSISLQSMFRVNSVAWNQDGQILASGSDDQTIILWDVRDVKDVSSGTQLRKLVGHTGPVRSVVWNPNGQTLASGSDDQTIILWDVRDVKDVSSGKLLLKPEEHPDLVSSVAWSPNGQTLASGSNDKTIILWDVRDVKDVSSGTQLRKLVGHTGLVSSVAWSPNGQTLASGSNDKTIILWDVKDVSSGTQLRKLVGHTDLVWSVAWNLDSKILASGSGDKTIILWDVSKGTQLRTLTGHRGGVRSVAWSPDGRTLASGGEDQTVILWEASSGRQLRKLEGHTGPVRSVAWNPDGQRLASGSVDKTIRLWNLTTAVEAVELLRERACRSANRNLTRAEWAQYIGDIEPYRATCLELPIEGETLKN